MIHVLKYHYHSSSVHFHHNQRIHQVLNKIEWKITTRASLFTKIINKFIDKSNKT